jgi:UDP-N-acetylglucosamine 2-epimerase (non-hydrolysing)
MKIACIVGARPNFIKIAPIMKELARFPDQFQPVLIHTGQHYDPKLSDVFFQDLDIPAPDHHLGVAAGTQAQQTGEIMVKFDELCAAEKFDRVLVVGDVTSTLACAITAKKRWIPVDHVEAGLRSFDLTMPEEINRMVTDAVADLFFVTEPAGVKNLLHEGHAPEAIKLVGNVMIDSLLANLEKAAAREKWRQYDLPAGGYALVTLHRPSNVDSAARLRQLQHSLLAISRRLPLIFPVHPRTRKNLDPTLDSAGLVYCAPLGYMDFVSLMTGAKLVITDSGGMQEETTTLGIPCLTLRNNTERPITMETGSNTLIGEDSTIVEGFVSDILAGAYKKGSVPELWDGKTSERIVQVLTKAVRF